MSDHPFVLSIVIPVYNGAGSVPTLLEHLAGLKFGKFEIILVNDGSPDNSLQVCRDLAKRLEIPITIADLARNFGEHNAVMAGLRLARGDYIITMDDDLQNPPSEVERLWRYASEHQFDVVYTHYATKQHAPWRNFGSWLTNYLASHLIGKPRDLYLSSFRCMAAFVAEHIVRHAGPYPYIDGLVIQTTQNVGKLQVEHLPRAAGRSNYTLRRLFRLFLSMFLNFSVIPLRIASIIGVLTAVIGIIGLVMVILEGLRGGQPTGWPSLMAVILTISGVQLIVLGLIGEYLGRAFLTLNQKPQSIVRTIERNDAAKLEGH